MASFPALFIHQHTTLEHVGAQQVRARADVSFEGDRCYITRTITSAALKKIAIGDAMSSLNVILLIIKLSQILEIRDSEY